MPKSLPISLLFTRLSIAFFLSPWVYKRLTDQGANKGLFAKYYGVAEMPDLMGYLIAGFWLALLICFTIGYRKKVSYFLVFALHALGTLFTVPYMIPGAENFKILFFAAVPTAAAMWLLWVLRKHDTMLALDKF